jgi:hypothetical protein
MDNVFVMTHGLVLLVQVCQKQENREMREGESERARGVVPNFIYLFSSTN